MALFGICFTNLLKRLTRCDGGEYERLDDVQRDSSDAGGYILLFLRRVGKEVDDDHVMATSEHYCIGRDGVSVMVMMVCIHNCFVSCEGKKLLCDIV